MPLGEGQAHSARVVRFSSADLRLFGDASHDRSSLHRDCERSRRGPYGGPIVFGGLGVLAALSSLPTDAKGSIGGIRVLFPQPMFVDVPYSIEVERYEERRIAVALTDSGRAVLRAVFTVRHGEPARWEVPVRENRPRDQPREWEPASLATKPRVSGTYGPARQAREALARRLGLAEKGLGGYALHSVLFGSYLVGMELPGERGLLSSLRISLPECGPGRPDAPLRYAGSVVEVDPRLGSMKVAATLDHGGAGPVSLVTCGAELQARPATFDRARLAELLPDSQRLAGKVGVVVGADGAIGSAVAAGLASQGCEVYGVVRDSERAPTRWASPIQIMTGDCASPSACRRLRNRIEAEQEGIDLVVCAAAPSIRSLRLHDSSVERFLQFIEASLRLAAVPLAAFLPALDDRRGCCVLPSTTALQTMPPDWGHYVTAKAASEVMVTSASQTWADVEFVVARLPLVRTERLGSLAKQAESVAVESVSAHIAKRAMSRRGPGVHVLEWDDSRGEPSKTTDRKEAT